MIKHISRSSTKKTVMSVEPGRISLTIGKDFTDDKVRDFVEVVDDIINDVVDTDNPCYGHFSFSAGKIEITLSKSETEPSAHDLTYRRDW